MTQLQKKLSAAECARKVPRRIAQAIINSLKGGVVPRVGLPYIAVGRTNEIAALLHDVDIIAEQIRIGLGDPLGYTQEDITFEGVGIEYRLIAEDPDNRFTPWVGRIDAFGWPSHPWLKMHTHVPTDESYEIPTEFDPNLALAIIWGENLEQAKERGMQFLDELTLQGENQSGELKSNVNFLRANTGRILRF